MSGNAQVETGPALTADAEAEHRRRILTELADQTDNEVKTIEAKLDGIKEALSAKKAEAKALRQQLKDEGGA
jgi:hypothetical protein